jgi:UDP-N-acetyl-2-amino-2-deoxyglucuronate dehydrogenase
MSLGFAIVGAGNIAGVQVEAIKRISEARVVVITGRGEASGRALAVAAEADWTQDLKAAVSRADVDVVSICTPSGAHMEPAVAAARAGKHLMIEKPLEITASRMDAILEAVQAAGVTLTCFFPSRFMIGVQKARKAINEGRLGKMVLADAFVKWYRSQEYYGVDWRGTWALDGGGALMNQSIHSIDILQWLAGSVESVVARSRTSSHEIETEDTATAILSFHSGAMGVIQGATSCWPGEPARVELRGTEGTIVLQEGRIVTWKLKDSSEEEESEMLALEQSLGSGSADPMGIGFEMHQRQISDMITAIRSGVDPAVDGIEARKAVEIILAIYQSVRMGSPVLL